MKSTREYKETLKKLQEQYNHIEREAKAMNETDAGYTAHIRALEKIIFQVTALRWEYEMLTAPDKPSNGTFFF